MKLLFATDFHLDLRIDGVDFHQDIAKALDEIMIAAQDVDLLVIGGDTFHTNRPTPRAYATFIRFLRDCGKPAIVLPGNHDHRAITVISEVPLGAEVDDYQIPFDSNDLQTSWSNQCVFVAHTPGIVEVMGKRFLVAGYISNSSARELGATNANEVVKMVFDAALKAEVDAAFCHLDIDWVRPGTEQAVARGDNVMLPRDLAQRLSCPILCGHVHRPHDDENIHVVGSVIPTSVDDNGDGGKRYAVVEV